MLCITGHGIYTGFFWVCIMTKIAIIGAGFAGLSIAHLLKNAAEITLFDKARGVGGRMATRRSDHYVFDHGAQYFTARTEAFQNFIRPLMKENIITPWHASYAKIRDSNIIESRSWKHDLPRYIGINGMNKVAKYLAKSFSVHLRTTITSLDHHGQWQLMDANAQRHGPFDLVIMTLPAPQASALLPTTFQYYRDIQPVKMLGCYALMLGFAKKIPLAFEAAHVIDSDLSWIAVNSSKIKIPDPFTLIVHSSSDYAEKNLTTDDHTVLKHMLETTHKTIGHDLEGADCKILQRWRYASNTEPSSQAAFFDPKLKLGVCGDWCFGGRVEGAFSSAHSLANMIKGQIL